jgi:hypothetical protein
VVERTLLEPSRTLAEELDATKGPIVVIPRASRLLYV